MDTNPAPPPRAPIQREDGWTPQVQERFIMALIEHGSVQAAAREVDRHVTSAYRLRHREPGFAGAWDAARRLAYARLRDEAMDRALNGTPEEVWHDGQWVGMKRVRSDRLLIALLDHLRADPPAGMMAPPDPDAVEDGRCRAAAATLALLALPPSPPPAPPPVRLRPARGRSAMRATPPGLGVDFG